MHACFPARVAVQQQPSPDLTVGEGRIFHEHLEHQLRDAGQVHLQGPRPNDHMVTRSQGEDRPTHSRGPPAELMRP